MADAIYYPKELGDVFDRALDRCFERICAGEEDSIAFLVVMTMDGAITDQRIAIEVTQDYFEPLTNLFSEEIDNIMIYAFAVVGHLLWKGKERKAVIIEAGERGNDESLILAQRYKVRNKAKQKFKLQQGKLKLVGVRDSRIQVTKIEQKLN